MPASVLVIDDAPYVREDVTRALVAMDPTLQVLCANDGLRGLVLLKQEPIDLVLCDVVMPNVDGFKLLKLVRDQSAFDDVPIILLTGEEHVREKVRGFALGAADYVTKPFDHEELCARVRVHLKVRALKAELKEKNARLETLVREDPLTGLKNRRAFDELLLHHFQQAERYRAPLALAMVDIDHFKLINDRFGHPVGDKILRAVAQLLVATARVQDVVVRYGGEEFAILMPHTDVPGALLAAERHRKRVASLDATEWDGPSSLTASFGVAAAPRADVVRAEGLVERADAALYRAKARGRNAVEADAPP